MSQYLLFYTEAGIVCIILFAIILFHDLSQVDRQEKQIKFDYALVSFMLYFFTDIFWAGIISGFIPRTLLSLQTVNYLLFLFMALITYTWFMYVLAVERIEHRNEPLRRFVAALPLLVSAVVAFVLYFFYPSVLINDDLSTNTFSTVLEIIVPLIYIIAILVFTVRRAIRAESPPERKMHLFVGGLPLAIVMGGLLQIFMLQSAPIFCFCCAIVMIIFYIQSLENRISIDPLTGLNNRGQLLHYVSQNSSLRREGKLTYVVMIDVNDFKQVNDSYGHAEGDHALVTIAESLKYAAGAAGFPVFIARYGGDEFVIIMHCEDEKGPEKLAVLVRDRIREISEKAGLPYTISISYGYDELSPYGESFADCLRRADKKSYQDKARQKSLR